jgi:hypothetical protein
MCSRGHERATNQSTKTRADAEATPEMTITDFATQHRLKTKHDKGDDTTIIPGKAGQLYEYSDKEFAVIYILPATKPARPRVWNRMRDLCVAAGMVLRQHGDAEGALSFNPENREQVKLAIKLAGVKRKRQMSEKQKAVAEGALRLALARKRGTAVPTEGTLAT